MNCDRCPCNGWPNVSQTRGMLCEPPIDILFVGEAPGTEELKAGMPFVGSAGWVLNWLISTSGIAGMKWRVTNSVRCAMGSAADKKPPRAAIRFCSEFLSADIDFWKPRRIVALGEYAVLGLEQSIPEFAEALKPYKPVRITKLSSVTLPPGVTIMFHPAFFLKPGNGGRIYCEVDKYRRLFDEIQNGEGPVS